MAEEQRNRTTCACGPSCSCSCGCGWPRGHWAFRIILGIVILLIVFWVGVKLGEFREAIGYGWGGYDGGYGYHQMMYRGGYGGYAFPGQTAPVQMYVSPTGPTTTPPSAQ